MQDRNITALARWGLKPDDHKPTCSLLWHMPPAFDQIIQGNLFTGEGHYTACAVVKQLCDRLFL